MIKTLEDLSRSMVVVTGKVDHLEKAEKKDLEQTVMRRIQDIEGNIREIRATMEQLEKYVPGSPKQMNF